MKHLFDTVSAECSKKVTRTYSTSFSLGIYCLNKNLHRAIYNIYGFVRLADEIVDSFHEFNKEHLLSELRKDTSLAIDRKISLNPILNSFQETVHEFQIEKELIDTFLDSMEMDLHQSSHSASSYQKYILGSAEVVGLMCLRVFTNKDQTNYLKLKPYAMKLGSAFQKVNFLRDIKADMEHLGRIYFPNVNVFQLTQHEKQQIEKEIESDFNEALQGIKQLPATSKFGVYVAFIYYKALFNKIKSTPSAKILTKRIRIPNYQKIGLLFSSYWRISLNLL